MEQEYSVPSPLFDKLVEESKRIKASFHFPGHRRGSAIPSCMRDSFGSLIFSADLPELPALDNLANPTGVIKEAEDLAAKVFSAGKSWFLVNGATSGMLAAIMSCCRPKRKVLVPRNVHQSVLYALILCGSIPVYIAPNYHANYNIAFEIPESSIEEQLREHRGEIDAVVIVSPNYHGYVSNISDISEICRRNDVILIVDEAHGAHFIFHPSFPPPALRSGADIVVHGTHKCLTSLTQTGMLHVSSDALSSGRIDASRISNALQLVQTSSPNYLLLASLDASRQQFEVQGEAMLQNALALSSLARSQLEEVPGFRVLGKRNPTDMFDPTRMNIVMTEDYWDCNGFDIDQLLIEDYGVYAELPSFNHLVFIISPGNLESDISSLVYALKEISTKLKKDSNTMLVSELPQNCKNWQFFGKTASRLFQPPFPLQRISPRDAFYHPHREYVQFADSEGRIAACTVSCYPPGIPILLPGEEISNDALTVIDTLRGFGATVTGFNEDHNTIQVV
ncbi:Arginine decarboxylase [Galdieria sulphuraria]|uniref:Lysine decarboxylase n=1 Tax=Galdieria sulphuraria TaxID=130081 RepID=M2XYK9_GALSU|nr:lysine decarboxylase [Galdieria sulphuraria]EME28559.1 lysine decarboxylase [Galdieria sulphuraria]GJD08517.1 Arginine decarboxylase [Galdieria sulphuraria]|eukprot:XP_005705079.1 lysine decarboxylase [Galdieria sulphuraria]